MRFSVLKSIPPLLLTFMGLACQAQVPHPSSHEFGDYWYTGKAELCRYDIRQRQYGEMRKGEAVFIFVTEDFNTANQVKQEHETETESTTVLKRNTIHRFVTGIYDYSVMTSVFTPIDINKFPHSLKVTNSVQDWCGQTFTQFNADEDAYRIRVFSYFQAQGDRDTTIGKTWLEDEIWNRIRISPQSLPLGNCRIVPSAKELRLSPIALGAYRAIATLTLEVTDEPGKEFFIYKVTYPKLKRALEIRFSGSFPYRIIGWEERNTDGTLRSSGKLTHWIQEPYWKLNNNADVHFRDTLGIDH